ncbi:hypothetical protein B0T25DRAFT_538989 [Lasiosphaeria hispida]|uniref:Uncharacterized protein n=1 Tax=Lasiosphaeria hispida TaxID=260671 RepID=A0AAJ0HML5_9PEZI|nr:hypothetical protein B0T25DRAFT_538989 [Lasiosphaeria hispida]
MAPVVFELTPSYIPVALSTLHVFSVTGILYIIGLGLYRSHVELGPAQDTRHRSSQRQKLATAFGSLAALGFSLAATSALSYLTLSYKVWAFERGIEVPDSVFKSSLLSSTPANGSTLYLTQWLSDTPIYFDALEILAEKARRSWWGQQLDLGIVSWTTLLAVEGRRRKIPFLWAYALGAHLVSLSFAQSLFYVSLLLTPSPIPLQDTRLAKFLNRASPPKPQNWTPKLSVFLVPLALNYAAIFSLPSATGTTWFPAAATIVKLLSFAPLVLPAIIPESWGTTHSHIHDSYRDISKVFQVMSVMSALLHAKASVTGLLYNLPDAYKHRHSIKILFDTEKRSAWDRSATAFEKVLGAVTDHPVVAAAGKDVLLSALSLGLWAAVRAMDAGDIVKSVAPSCEAFGSSSSGKASADIHEIEPRLKEKAPGPSFELSRLRDQPTQSSASSISSSNGPSDDGAPTPRKRGRPRKIKTESEADLEEIPGDSTYEPTPEERSSIVEGDIVPGDEFDWESAALAWGLTALGGLGAGSAAVFGAECVSR